MTYPDMAAAHYYDYCDSPLGKILIVSNTKELTFLCFENQRSVPDLSGISAVRNADDPVISETRRWLGIYFSGSEPTFCPPLAPACSPFASDVLEILRTVPYGKTVSYGEIAERVRVKRGMEKMSAQAVGGAVGRNPVAIIIPCHRVIGKNGSPVGYGGGLWRKEFLLALENKNNM